MSDPHIARLLQIGLPTLVWFLALGSTLWGTWYAVRQRGRVVAEPWFLPPVSILKPLKGVDAGFEENLSCFFRLDYPCYELIFSVDSPEDPAADAVRAEIARHPLVRARLVVGAMNVGPNPKVNNLVIPYDRAAYDCVLISDSNVRVGPDYLRHLVPYLKPDVGIVTAVVAGTESSGVGGLLEAAYLNSFYARWMHLSSAVGHTCVVGKSMLFRRSVLNRVGGIRALGQYIAEDYMAGRAMYRLGLRVVIMGDPIRQFIGDSQFGAFWSRHIRWGRIRKAQAPLAFLFEPLFGALLSGLVGALAFRSWQGTPWGWFFGAHLLLWFICDGMLMRTLAVKIEFRSFAGWVLRECLAFPLWCHIAIGNRINWRGRRLRIGPGGVLA